MTAAGTGKGALLRRRRIARLLERDGATCWLCGKPLDVAVERGPWKISVDHVKPRSAGGGNELSNLRLAHRLCNTRRGSDGYEADVNCAGAPLPDTKGVS